MSARPQTLCTLRAPQGPCRSSFRVSKLCACASDCPACRSCLWCTETPARPSHQPYPSEHCPCHRLLSLRAPLTPQAPFLVLPTPRSSSSSAPTQQTPQSFIPARGTSPQSHPTSGSFPSTLPLPWVPLLQSLPSPRLTPPHSVQPLAPATGLGPFTGCLPSPGCVLGLCIGRALL